MSDLPDGGVDKNPPAGSRDMGSIPGPGSIHVPQGNQAPEPTRATALRN